METAEIDVRIGIPVDLNRMFGFDHLKEIIEALMNALKKNNDSITDLQTNVSE
jgi:hypothetical protein